MPKETLYVWSKVVRAVQAEVQAAKVVAAGVPSERVAIISKPAGFTVRLEAYQDSMSAADALAREFGGTVKVTRPAEWLAASTVVAKPLAFGARLLVTGRQEEIDSLRSRYPRKTVLCIPAAMAFGSGEHATTAMCLRLLDAVSRGLTSARRPWDVLDLGTGSGVLALAARSFGAASALGLDHDPHAVRIARENGKANAISRAAFRRVDLLRDEWMNAEARQWPLITANLFSELLISILPRIGRHLSPAGSLIASGVLRVQSEEVETAFENNGFRVAEKRQRGRWVAYLVRR